MSRAAPPTLAHWMLAHLAPGESNEALAGDLHEEFCAGRSAAWYWRQVLSAIAIRCARELRVHRVTLLFAFLWSMLAPAWMLAIASLEQHANLNEHLAQMTWPWSTLCDLGLTLIASLLFLWTGILLYLFPDLWLAGKLRLRELARGLAASLPALLILWLALIVFPRHFIAVRAAAHAGTFHVPTPLEAYRISQRRLGVARGSHEVVQSPEAGNHARPELRPRDAIADMRTPALLVRLPFFLVVLRTLWPATTRTRHCAS